MFKNFLIAAFAAASVQPIWSLASGIWSFICYLITVLFFFTIVEYVEEWIDEYEQRRR
ncbi:MAG: hypothetical protein PHS82_06355 [Lachnospiraceae bacterium]|nr:hypothetical protein [Lachnospiraceae bacterium]